MQAILTFGKDDLGTFMSLITNPYFRLDNFKILHRMIYQHVSAKQTAYKKKSIFIKSILTGETSKQLVHTIPTSNGEPNFK